MGFFNIDVFIIDLEEYVVFKMMRTRTIVLVVFVYDVFSIVLYIYFI